MGTGLPFNVQGPIAADTSAQPGGTLAAPTHPGASLGAPSNVAFGSDGTLYVLAGILSVVPGPLSPTSRSHFLAGGGKEIDKDTYYQNADFTNAFGLAMGPDGRLVVADGSNNRIRVVTPDGWVHTLAGGGVAGESVPPVDGAGTQARLHYPYAVAVAHDGTVYVADQGNHVLRRIRRGGPTITR
jgi:glucose/arabinose dehydrogenase